MIDAMLNPLKKAIELQKAARSSRKKGDAFRKASREKQAVDDYRSGVEALKKALELLNEKRKSLLELSPPLPDDETAYLLELVEIYGALGGMYQRLGEMEESLASYAEGAGLEEKFRMTSTYNRLNAVKYSLLTGHDPLRSFEARIQTLADFIDTNLRANKSLSDQGWAWADLGDCLALLGRTEEASKAYATFIEKAEIKSPERTLEILNDIASKLQSNSDPDASRLKKAIDVLKTRLISL